LEESHWARQASWQHVLAHSKLPIAAKVNRLSSLFTLIAHTIHYNLSFILYCGMVLCTKDGMKLLITCWIAFNLF
jgi:hypothetical protein